ncbi:hypothetical protein SZ39_6024 [Bacillus mycoides]|nr:hypothetical protein SZ39_6024 [Bacillus mycoides]
MEKEKERDEVRGDKYAKFAGYVLTCIGIFIILQTLTKKHNRT